MVLAVDEDGRRRLYAVLAESVLDLVPATATVPGLRLPEAPWLGGHLPDEPGMPQLMDPGQLLPDELSRLFQDAESIT